MENRVFTSKDSNGNDVILRFNRPTQKILNEADFAYKQHFSKCLRNGIMTQNEAVKIIRELGTWKDEDEVKLKEIRDKITGLESQFSENPSEDVGNKLFIEIKIARSELNDMNTRLTSITENTAESMSGDYRIQYLASQCVVYNDSGKKVFKDLEDLILRSNEKIAVDSTTESLIANFEATLGITLPPGELLEENKWLKKIEEAKSSVKVELEKEDKVEVLEKRVYKKKNK